MSHRRVGRSVMIVDDNQSFATLVRLAFLRDGRFSIVGSADNGADALATATAIRPEVIILDDDMPVRSGLDVLPELSKLDPRPLIIVFSASLDPAAPARARGLGANAVVSKLDPIRVLVEVVVELAFA